MQLTKLDQTVSLECVLSSFGVSRPKRNANFFDQPPEAGCASKMIMFGGQLPIGLDLL